MASYLLDTNVLLRFMDTSSREHSVAFKAVAKLAGLNERLTITPQNLVEMWSVATRPVPANGWGKNPTAADSFVQRALRSFELLEDDPTFFFRWRALVSTHQVSGRNVHDARLAAVMLTYRVPVILTFNPADFNRYPGIQVLHPAQV